MCVEDMTIGKEGEGRDRRDRQTVEETDRARNCVCVCCAVCLL